MSEVKTEVYCIGLFWVLFWGDGGRVGGLEGGVK